MILFAYMLGIILTEMYKNRLRMGLNKTAEKVQFNSNCALPKKRQNMVFIIIYIIVHQLRLFF